MPSNSYSWAGCSPHLPICKQNPSNRTIIDPATPNSSCCPTATGTPYKHYNALASALQVHFTDAQQICTTKCARPTLFITPLLLRARHKHGTNTNLRFDTSSAAVSCHRAPYCPGGPSRLAPYPAAGCCSGAPPPELLYGLLPSPPAIPPASELPAAPASR
jgi:hypothetical protein